ncbi:3D domain-containing protein [Thermosipho atlanticus]|uniref:3D (Asp-Asp-Asp) domain-containing protein n=1 Tax=Thermosipho atlanticus DSM 15807 TaxID=1123380 RepID=A0A1M5R5U6_9BACT|nr:3D domain-containing protein [Thermosipho atlanticus]SHH21430.1 3D (Asp-Asp-Asp) domain-containing protein [Thermosipho atlanticus DSM 15807]
MKNIIKKMFFLSLVILFLFSCNYVTYDDFNQLKLRVDSLEATVKDHGARLRNLESELSSLNISLTNRFNAIEQKISNLEKDSDFSYLEDYVKQIALEVSNLQNQLNKVTAELTAYSLKTIIYRLNEVESLSRSLDLEDVKKIVDEAVTKFENGYNEIVKIEEKLNDLELALSALRSTVQEIQTVKAATNTNYVISTTQISGNFEKLESLEKNISILNQKIENLTNQNTLQRDLALIRQISEELNFLKQRFSEEDIIELLKLRVGYINYIVRPGDTLYEISKKYSLGSDGVQKLISFNGITDPKKIMSGQVIKIPVENPESFVKIPLLVAPEDILSYFGDTINGVTNLGIDISAPGKKVYPILPGRVTVKGNNVIYVDHGSGILGIYKGVENDYKEGDWVTTDKTLGKVVNVFHFELWIDGEPRDPFRLFFSYKGIFKVSFYTPWDDGKVPEHPTFKITRTGNVAKEWVTAAVDPSVIPLGSFIYIPSLKKVFVAEDTGSSIKGNRIDIYIEDVYKARKMGIKDYKVYVFQNGGN